MTRGGVNKIVLRTILSGFWRSHPHIFSEGVLRTNYQILKSVSPSQPTFSPSPAFNAAADPVVLFHQNFKRMKTFLSTLPSLLLLSLLQLATHTARAQEQNVDNNVYDINDNVNINVPRTRPRNINVMPATGPNGLNPSQAIINVNPRININVTPPTGPNGPNLSQVLSSQKPPNQSYPSAPKPVVARQAAPKPVRRPVTTAPRPRPVAPAVSTQRPRPKPQAPRPGAAVQRRPAARPTVAAAPRQVRPRPMPPAPAVPSPAPQPQVSLGNQSVQAIILPPVVQQVSNNIIAQAPVEVAKVFNNEAPRPVRSSASAGSSGSSGKAHRSTGKKYRSFCQHANKKFMKLFASNKKRKIDPAKCFAWK